MIRRRQTRRRRRGSRVGEQELEHPSPLSSGGFAREASRHVLETLDLGFAHVQRVAAPPVCSCGSGGGYGHGCGCEPDGSSRSIIRIGNGRTAEETAVGLAGVVFLNVFPVVPREARSDQSIPV